MNQPFDYINKTYGVNACIGRRVTVYGDTGTIVSDKGHHLGVNFDKDKPQRVLSCHPTSEVVYHDEVVKPRKVGRSARRYQEWLNSDCGYSFAKWLGINKGIEA